MAKGNNRISDKALRDYAFRVMMSEFNNLKLRYPTITPAEIGIFVDQLSPNKLTQIYGMFFETGMVL